MKKYNELTRHEQEAYLMLPILTELKKLGGQSTTKDLKRSVVANDSSIPENTLTEKVQSIYLLTLVLILLLQI